MAKAPEVPNGDGTPTGHSTVAACLANRAAAHLKAGNARWASPLLQRPARPIRCFVQKQECLL